MTRTDFIEKLTNTGMFTLEEATVMADRGDDLEELCLMMYYSMGSLDDFNDLVGDCIGRDFTQEQIDSLSDIMDEEW